jgi:hypothetical protein
VITDLLLSAPQMRRVNVGIASPGDVAAERAAVLRVLSRWNAQLHHNAMLIAVGWELASVPTLGEHPQKILNKQIIERCQLLVAVFWSKLGTPTPIAPSGTVEEIDEFINLKGPARVMLYFCTRDVPPEFVDQAELSRLRDYKAEMRSRGLYYEYRSLEEFERVLYQHLDAKVAEFLAGRLPPPGGTGQTAGPNVPLLRLDLPYQFGEPRNRVLPIVQNSDMWQVVFGFSIRNEGTADARNWRVRLVTSDGGTLMGINRALDGRNVTETFVGPGWQYEVFSAGAGDTVPAVAGMATVLAGRHTLNFRDRPETVEVKCLLTADSMPAHEAVLRLEPDWTTMTARFR